jgi:AraC family transcriptional regulator
MTAIGDVTAAGQGVGTLDRDELAQLIIEASTSFETDQYKAKCCIQRAAELVRDKRARGSHGVEAPVVRGGLAGWQMKKVTAYIESNIGGRIPAAELAGLVRLSMGHFYRAFRTSFRTTPQAYIMRRRISRAEVLMATSSEPLARIALDCGLCDQAHFSRTFRRVIGVSPNIWRRQLECGPPSATALQGVTL